MLAADLDRWKLALGWHVVTRLVAADGAVTSSESVYLERAFPRGAMEGAGFVDAHGAITPELGRAIEEAVRELPKARLDVRLSIVETVWKAAFVDGRLHGREAELAQEAGRLLRLTTDQVATKLGFRPL